MWPEIFISIVGLLLLFILIFFYYDLFIDKPSVINTKTKHHHYFQNNCVGCTTPKNKQFIYIKSAVFGNYLSINSSGMADLVSNVFNNGTALFQYYLSQQGQVSLMSNNEPMVRSF